MKVLLVGGNGFGKVHAESLRNLGLEFGVFDRRRDVLDFYASAYGVTALYDDLGTALKSDFDIADIVLPHFLHRDTAISAMEAGKHVLIEKPISMTLQEAHEMISLSERSNLKLMVAEQYHFDPAIALSKRLITRGRIGELKTIIMRDQRFFGEDGWRRNAAHMGGGALIDGGIHFVDAILNIGGEYEKIRGFSYHGGSRIEGDDTSMALFSFTSGAHGLLFYSWSYDHPPEVPAFEFIGTGGSIYEDRGTAPGVGFRNVDGKRYAFGAPVLNGKRQEMQFQDVFDLEISSFVEAVEKNLPVPNPTEGSVKDLRAVLEISGAESGN